MRLIPGWESVAGTHRWSGFFFWASIVSLLLLGVFEVVSHRYSERKDELAAIEEAKTQRRHDDEMTRLHLEASKANSAAAAAAERAGKLEVEAGRLRLALDATAAETARISQGLANRHLFESQRALITSALRGKNFHIEVQSIHQGDPEVNGYAEELMGAFRAAGLTVTFFSDVGMPPPRGLIVIDSVDRAHSEIAGALDAARVEFEFRETETPNPIVRVGIRKSEF